MTLSGAGTCHINLDATGNGSRGIQGAANMDLAAGASATVVFHGISSAHLDLFAAAVGILSFTPIPGILSISDALRYVARLLDGPAATAEIADAQATMARVSSRA